MVGNKINKQMTQHEKLSLRQVNCGTFEACLISAWFVADNQNKERLEKAFKNTTFDLT